MLATHYEDAALHHVGKLRTEEWFAAQDETLRIGCATRTGCALTFWYQLDESKLLALPDGIAAGLRSLKLAQFEKVFCLTYGQVLMLMLMMTLMRLMRPSNKLSPS